MARIVSGKLRLDIGASRSGCRDAGGDRRRRAGRRGQGHHAADVDQPGLPSIQRRPRSGPADHLEHALQCREVHADRRRRCTSAPSRSRSSIVIASRTRAKELRRSSFRSSSIVSGRQSSMQPAPRRPRPRPRAGPAAGRDAGRTGDRHQRWSRSRRDDPDGLSGGGDGAAGLCEGCRGLRVGRSRRRARAGGGRRRGRTRPDRDGAQVLGCRGVRRRVRRTRPWHACARSTKLHLTC